MGRDTKSYYNKLAILTSRIWFEDDQRKYNNLEKTAEKLLILRTIRKDKAKRISKIIRKSYERYGLLDDNKIKDTVENVFDNSILSNFIKIYDMVNETNSKKQAKHHALWWKNFFLKKQIRLKRPLKLFYHIFLYNKNKVKSILPSLFCTVLLIQAGMRHDKRDFQGTVNKLITYWKQIDRSPNKHVVF